MSSLDPTEMNGRMAKVQPAKLKIDFKAEFNFQFSKKLKIEFLTTLFIPNIMGIGLNQKCTDLTHLSSPRPGYYRAVVTMVQTGLGHASSSRIPGL